MPYRGPFCTELGDHPVEDCVAASGVDVVAAAGLRIPTGAAEREALRVASGDTSGGMTLEALQVGIKVRYNLDARLLHGQLQIEAALDFGYSLAVIGRYDVLPREWRWQAGADFLHAMWFDRNDAATRWRSDPLAYATNPGAAMPDALFRSFAASFGWHALGLIEGSAATSSGPILGGDMLPISSPVPMLIDIPVHVQLYDLAGAPLVKVSTGAKAQVSPFEVAIGPRAHYRGAIVTTKGVRQLVLIHNPDANVRPIPVAGLPTDPTPYGPADLLATRTKTKADAIAAIERMP